MNLVLTLELANELAELPLAGIDREYPNHPGLTLNGPQDLQSPRELHPAFYGCYDWHSAVHGHWCLLRLMRHFSLKKEAEIRAKLRANITPANIAREVEYFLAPNRQSFERPYGWGWLLQLVAELKNWDDADGKAWRDALRPLEAVIVERFLAFLPKQTYPIQNGVHTNTSFGMLLALEYAITCRNQELQKLLVSRTNDYFGDPELGLEPNGADFLSPSLVMSILMARTLPADEYRKWFEKLFPTGIPQRIKTPVIVSDRTDPQIGHLDGLNLSRAWCYRQLARTIGEQELQELANAHLSAAEVATGDYGGEHWLATFAVLALTDPQ